MRAYHVLILLVLLLFLGTGCSRKSNLTSRQAVVPSQLNLAQKQVKVIKQRKSRPAPPVPGQPQVEKPNSYSDSYPASASGDHILQDEVVDIEYTGFHVKYSTRLKIPLMVTWELTQEEALAVEKYSAVFSKDPYLEIAQPGDGDYNYQRDRWTRGHMIPKADLRWTNEGYIQSHYFTNICPQAEELNNGGWRSVEEKCRTLAKKYGSISIVCGPIINDIKETIGDGKVAVPSAFYKVMYMTIRGKYCGIGFLYPNIKEKTRPMPEYAKSIDEIEEITGYDFFSNLPDEIENEVERAFDFNMWQ